MQRRAKSDGIDAELLLRTLLAWLQRGAARVLKWVPIPGDEADEDERYGASGNGKIWCLSVSVWSIGSMPCWRPWE